MSVVTHPNVIKLYVCGQHLRNFNMRLNQSKQCMILCEVTITSNYWLEGPRITYLTFKGECVTKLLFNKGSNDTLNLQLNTIFNNGLTM